MSSIVLELRDGITEPYVIQLKSVDVATGVETIPDLSTYSAQKLRLQSESTGTATVFQSPKVSIVSPASDGQVSVSLSLSDLGVGTYRGYFEFTHNTYLIDWPGAGGGELRFVVKAKIGS